MVNKKNIHDDGKQQECKIICASIELECNLFSLSTLNASLVVVILQQQ